MRSSRIRRQRHSRGHRLTWGVILLVLGAVLLAGNLGYMVPREIWRYWPFLLLGLGVSRLLLPNDHDGRRGGFWLIVVGLYGWVSEWHVLGLEWGTAWPLFVIAAGVLIAFDAFRCRGEIEDSDESSAIPTSGDEARRA